MLHLGTVFDRLSGFHMHDESNWAKSLKLTRFQPVPRGGAARPTNNKSCAPHERSGRFPAFTSSSCQSPLRRGKSAPASH